MNTIENEKYYMEQLSQQVSFLIDSCHSYDAGNFAQAKIMSGVIRNLFKDPENVKRKTKTKSLLSHLDKKSIRFYNTGFEAKDAKINFNLVGIATVPSKLPTLT